MDILCAVCGEPWENYELRKEFNADNENWRHLSLALGKEHADSQETPFTWFSKGRGCPSCDMGTKKPIFPGQTFKLKEGIRFPAYLSISKGVDGEALLELRLGDTVTVDLVDSDTVRNRLQTIYVLTLHRAGESIDAIAGREIITWESEFRSYFDLVESDADRERAEDMKLQAAKSACSASDRDPLAIMEERGLDY